MRSRCAYQAGAPPRHQPRTLPEAIAALRADAVLVDELGHEIVRAYTGALSSTWRRYQAFVTDWEIAEYREIL